MTDTAPLIEIRDVVKIYPAPQPLRLVKLDVHPGERLVLSGFDTGAAEMFVHLVTGAALPDEGAIAIAGRNTRDISTDTEWLLSLDLFGLVTERAVLIGQIPIAANMALPMTLAIDPIPDEFRVRVEALAREVGLPASRLSAPAATLTPAERVRVHLARALALDPRVVILEHPTTTLATPEEGAAFGDTLARLSAERQLAWIALSNDDAFGRASRGSRRQLNPATGLVRTPSLWTQWLTKVSRR